MFEDPKFQVQYKKYHQQVKCNPFQHKFYQFLSLRCLQCMVFLNFLSVSDPMSTIFLNNQDHMQDERKATLIQNLQQFYQEQVKKCHNDSYRLQKNTPTQNMKVLMSHFCLFQQKESSQLIQYRHPVSESIQNEFEEKPLQIYLTLPNYPKTLNGLQEILPAHHHRYIVYHSFFQLNQVIMTKLEEAANDLDFIKHNTIVIIEHLL
ncbi:unnamed protein product [Paramecium pentaurelia]|uniref:Uncharacterized protein n=1 Tax=Paramecium pentaurelia TaxID=43138 RepID=A0A8S1THL7_9CILI|nr:unnamed protein product [Paramecium pentaurelia]